ncbi:TonB-dependent receptor [Acidipila sp. EB88]|uniref:TonB-dependent receptor n=1 Tax=Acidipila sp. EB88 TaxID=2305226 RepID=UPI000F5ED3C0|nr:TonB-dependent receptor [Acidipila sp. EB88]RRA48170.1 TonB-dependent receptor [Acidipila sp. EB88]
MRTSSALVLFCSSLAVPVFAQDAQLSGAVRDQQHAVIVGAQVNIVNEHTGQVLTTRTDKGGLYSLPTLDRGLYTIQVSAEGFRGEEFPHVNVDVGAKLLQDVTLSVGSASDTVKVNAEGSGIITSDATVSTVINRQFVENLPLNGRSFQSLITLAPGTSVVPSQGVGSSGEISVNGQRTEANYYTIDGISANTGATVSTAGYPGAGFSGSTPQESALGTTQSIVSIDALEQFRTSTSSYAAEYGRTPGGQFNFSTRSGTNQWHGTAFDFLRNDALDAKNVFDTTKLPERQNDFGGTLGGYLRIPKLYDGRDKTFFFFSYEGLRLTNPVAATLYEVPSQALRASAPAALQPFLNAFPVSTSPDLGGCTGAFTGCANPDLAGLAYLTVGYSAPSRLDTTSIRIDHSFSERLRIFGRYSDVPSQSVSRQPTDLAQVNGTVRNVKTVVLGADSILTHNLANEFRVGVTGNDYQSSRSIDNFGGATPLAISSAPGLTNGDWMTFFMFYGLYPYYLIEPQSNRQRQVNVVDSFTQTLHRHTLTYGVDYRRLITSETLPPLWEVGFFYSAASILGNNPDGLYVYTQDINMKARQLEFSAYAQDEWRVSDRLSVSAGVRWDLNPPPNDVNGNTPYTADQITNLATTVAAPKGTPLWQTRYANFGPRVGVAYQLNQTPGHESVLRAGGGVFYDTGVALSAEGYYGIGTTGFASYSAPFPATSAQVQATPVPSASAPYNAPIYAFDPHLNSPYTGQWNVALEQALGDKQSLNINYVASAGRRLLVQRFYDPETLGNTAFSQGKGLYVTTGGASSDYNSLQIKFNRKLSRGVQFLASYTWSHALDDDTSNLVVYQQERANSDYDIRHSLQAAGSFELGGRYNNPLLAYALRHWAMDLRESVRSALPVDVLDGSSVVSTTGVTANFHPDRNPDQPLYLRSDAYAGGRTINPAAFTAVAGEGNAGRNIARGFDAVQTDLTLRRDFPIHDRLGVQFRAEAYNVFNHPIYGSIYNTLSSGPALFGQTYNTLNNQLGGLSALYQVGGPRSMQVALKLHF